MAHNNYRHAGPAGRATPRGDGARHILTDWAHAWSPTSADSMLALFTDDLVYEDVAAEHIMRSKRELAEFYTMGHAAFPDFQLQLTSHVVSGSRAAAEWTMTGTHRGALFGLAATGKRMSMRGVSVFEIQGDQLRRCTDYYNVATMMKQLGA